MDNFLFKLCAYALLGLVVLLIILKFAWFAAIGLIVFGLFYFGIKRLGSRSNRNEE